MTSSVPESVTAEGNVKAAFVPAIAAPDTGPTVAEMTAGVIISGFLMPGWGGFAGTQNKGDDRRFNSRQTFQKLGRVNHEVVPLEGTLLPQELGTPGHAANKVYETLAPDTVGWLVIGYGLDAEENAPFVATDIVDYAPIQAGEQFKGAVGADEFAPLTYTQELVTTGLKRTDKAIVAL